MKECACNMLTDVKSLTHLRLCHMCMRVDMACMHEDSQVALSMADRAAEFKIVGCKEICMHPVAALCCKHNFGSRK